MVEISRFDEVGWKTAPREAMFSTRSTKQMQSQEGPKTRYNGFDYTLQNNGDGTWTWRVYDISDRPGILVQATVVADAHEWGIPQASAQDWIDQHQPEEPEIDPGLIPEEEEEDVPGCMDPDSLNYNPLATVDDGSCKYKEEEEEEMGEFVWIGALAMLALFVIFIGKGSEDAS